MKLFALNKNYLLGFFLIGIFYSSNVQAGFEGISENYECTPLEKDSAHDITSISTLQVDNKIVVKMKISNSQGVEVESDLISEKSDDLEATYFAVDVGVLVIEKESDLGNHLYKGIFYIFPENYQVLLLCKKNDVTNNK